ncbi:DMT family transporter [Rhodoferax saidenbachensis]|uniref:EamA family transporter n=1 Tax=Rhodoferax saidenbachensis TaxID=1484693 RepID=A0A1P8K8G5_9BURK|nr:DMT family transporter [Rhodoferax saidenbachensis]APW42294.1 EamA family transporter [Rhodoferax saidenbachensis]
MKTRFFAQLVALSALWGASFMLIRIAVPVLGPNVLAALRIGLATVTLALLMRLMRHRWPLAHWRELTLLGLLTVALPFLLFAWAGLQIPAGYSALLNTTAVLFGTFASAWLKEDTLTPRKLFGCLLGFVGVALILRLGPVALTGRVVLAVLACVAASACYGVATPLMKRATTRMQPLEIAMGIHSAALLMLLPGAAWSLPQAQFTPGALAAVAMLGIVTSGIAYWMHLRIMRNMTPVAAMSPVFMVPVFGVAWGHVFLDEPLGAGLFWGGALVLVASALVSGFNPLSRWLDAVDAKP